MKSIEMDWEMGGLNLDLLVGGTETMLHQYTANSIALHADPMPAKCLKGFKNRTKISKRCRHRKYRPNQHVAGMNAAQSAIECVVNITATINASEVQHA